MSREILSTRHSISKVFCDLHLFEVYVKGFLKGCGGALTDLEVEMLPMGAILMTFECGMRFLADYGLFMFMKKLSSPNV